MKKLLVFIFIIGLVSITFLGCNDNNWGYDIDGRRVRLIERRDELDGFPDGELGFGDFLFIDETTTIQDIIDRNGPPDAFNNNGYLDPLVTWYYKLSDGGVFSYIQHRGPDVVAGMNSGDRIMRVSYEDITIILYASEEYYNWRSEGYYNWLRERESQGYDVESALQSTRRVVYLKVFAEDVDDIE